MRISIDFKVTDKDEIMWDESGLMLEDGEGYVTNIKCPKAIFEFIKRVHACGISCGRKELSGELRGLIGIKP
jgi:hypothetical protein